MVVLEAPTQDRRNRPLAAIAAVALLAAAACVWLLLATRPGPAAAPEVVASPGGVGDTVAFTDADGNQGTITLLSIRRTTEKEPGSRFLEGPKWSYLIAEFKVTATVASPATGGPFIASRGFQAVGPSGDVYVSRAAPNPVEIGDLHPRLAAGESTQGVIGFDAPVGKLRIDFRLGGTDPQGTSAPVVASFNIDG